MQHLFHSHGSPVTVSHFVTVALGEVLLDNYPTDLLLFAFKKPRRNRHDFLVFESKLQNKVCFRNVIVLHYVIVESLK